MIEKDRIYDFNGERRLALDVLKQLYELLPSLHYSYSPPILLILTGSWGIEATTEVKIDKHNDIDMQLFFPEGINHSKLLKLILRDYKLQKNQKLFKLIPQKQNFPLVEISLYQYTSVVGNNIYVNNSQIPIPVCNGTLEGEVHVRAKKLEYQIATWIIRLFGQPLKPRREALPRDFEYLKIMLSRPYDKEELLKYLSTHHQFNRGASPEEVLLLAKNYYSL